ncbi:thioredoxin-disulfide reductase [Flaviflexus huanghaiensis]|uniref:thioredoxin-disulfide reductase n=1 Tax=Flaviflexus huanghaiensis TaxID=1111473 RepID=UPI0015FCCCF1|nr:thioredoxin-disulfide reductase [Flaviflexus huanghaiensis]
MTEIHDIIIVGSGPAGYTAAIYTARAGLKPLVLAGAIDAGGALMTTTEVENFPGFPEGIQGPALMENMREQAERFGADVRFEDATELKLEGDIKEITTDTSDYRAKAVILALGSEYRKLGLEGETIYSGKGVSWCATCDGFFFRGQEIAVVGGGDSAVTEALFLKKFASKVTVIHRRDELRASKVMADRLLAADQVEMAWNSAVTKINGTPDGRLKSVTLTDTHSGEQRELPVGGLFIAIGHDPRTALVKDQLDVDVNGYITVDHPTTATSLPGVFACGDVVDHRYRQAITAAGTGCSAALDAEKYLDEL